MKKYTFLLLISIISYFAKSQDLEPQQYQFFRDTSHSNPFYISSNSPEFKQNKFAFGFIWSQDYRMNAKLGFNWIQSYINYCSNSLFGIKNFKSKKEFEI